MALFDLPETELRTYMGSGTEPSDFDAFWHQTITGNRQFDWPPEITLVDTNLTTVDVFDVRFPGFGGQPIAAWLRVPRGASGPLPTVVEFVGYGGGRGYPEESLLWASSGFAHFQMDTRGQGSVWSTGDTGDDGQAGPAHPGFMTRGILRDDSDEHTGQLRRRVLRAPGQRAALRLDRVDGRYMSPVHRLRGIQQLRNLGQTDSGVALQRP